VRDDSGESNPGEQIQQPAGEIVRRIYGPNGSVAGSCHGCSRPGRTHLGIPRVGTAPDGSPCKYHQKQPEPDNGQPHRRLWLIRGRDAFRGTWRMRGRGLGIGQLVAHVETRISRASLHSVKRQSPLPLTQRSSAAYARVSPGPRGPGLGQNRHGSTQPAALPGPQ